MDGEFYQKVSESFEKTSKLTLPHLPESESVDAWIDYGVELLQCLAFLATKVDRWFAWFVNEETLDCHQREKEFCIAKTSHDDLQNYFFQCSFCDRWLKKVVQYERKVRNEINPYNDNARQSKFIRDVESGKDVRRSTYASHVMWELARLRIIVNIKKTRGKTRFACASHFPNLVKEGFTRDFHGPILRYDQYQLRACLFKMCRRLKSRQFSQELNAYIDLLIDRGCAFFCGYFNDGSINITSMRQKVNHSLPFEKRGTTDLLLGAKDGEVTEESKGTSEYYSISFEFVYFWQLYYNDMLSRIKTLLDRPIVAQNHYFTAQFNDSWIGNHINWKILRKACIDKSYRVASELREEYERVQVKSYIHPVEKTLFLKDNAAYSEKTKDLRMIEKLFSSQYLNYLNKSKRTINEVLMQDELDVDETSSYEWVVLKLIDGLLGVKVDFFNQFVYDRERLMNEMEKVACNNVPIVIQCYARYFVYYQKKLFIDDALFKQLSEDNTVYEEDAEKTLSLLTMPQLPINWQESPNYLSLCAHRGNVIGNNWSDSINIYQVVEFWIYLFIHRIENSETAEALAESLRIIKEKTVNYNTTIHGIKTGKLIFR